MQDMYIKKTSNHIILLSIILIGLYLRSINLFFEDFWADEMLGFANSDPTIGTSETFKKIKNSEELTPILFHFLTKYFYKFFGYSPENGRILTLIIGTASIPITFLLCKELNKKSALLLSFLISTNIYLINYSQEVRPYILLFFFSALNIYLFLKLANYAELKKNNIFLILSFIICSILGFATHPFFFIILISEVIFCIMKNHYKNNVLRKTLFLISFTSALCLLVQYDYIINLLQNTDHYIDVHNEKYADLFFPRFFGSKIIGLIYFLFLSLLLIKFRKKSR